MPSDDMAPKKRSFNGCWTCRGRKVKCDLAKPSCYRCEKSGLQCEGYHIKLGWSDPQSLSVDGSLVSITTHGEVEESFQRRNIDLVKYPKHMIFKNYDEIDDALGKLEQDSQLMEQGSCNFGPFTMFSLRNYNRQSHTSHPVIPKKRTRHESISLDEPNQSSHPQIHIDECIKVDPLVTDPSKSRRSISNIFTLLQPPSIPGSPYQDTNQALKVSISNSGVSFTKKHTNENIWIHPNLLQFAKLSIVALRGPTYNYNEHDMLHILYPKFFPSMNPTVYKASKEVLNLLYRNLDAQNCHISLNDYASGEGLLLCPTFNKLIKTFVDNLDLFMVVTFRQNYMLSTVLPLIWKILGELIGLNFMNSERLGDSEMNLNQILKESIIYQVLCLSSFILAKSLQIPSTEREVYTKISIELRSLGLEGMKNCLKITANFDELVLSILLQIRIDNWFGVFENFTFLFGTLDDLLVKNRDDLKNQELVDVFEMMKAYFDSTKSVDLTNYKIDENDEIENYQDIRENYNLIDRESIEYDKDYYVKKIQIQPSKLISCSTDDKTVNDSEKPPPSFTISFQNEETNESEGETEPLDRINDNHKKQFKLIKIPNESDEIFSNSNFYSSMNLVYGMPNSLSELFTKIITLTNHRNIFHRKNVFPRNFPKICADIEDELLNWELDWKLFEINYNSNSEPIKEFYSDFHKGIYHNILSFYHALIIYFSRLIKDVTPRLLQDHVAQTLYHVNELLMSNWGIKPLFWQYFISGCDATEKYLQNKYEEGFESYSKANNFWRAKQIMLEVWKRREAGEDDVCWIDIVREWEVILFLG